MSPGANQYLGPFAVGPDGAIFAVGPEPDRLQALGRTGRLRWISLPRGGHFRYGKLAVSPEGRAYVVRTTSSSASIVEADHDGVSGSELALPVGDEGTDFFRLALGAGGRVYVSSRRAVYATCRGRRLDWVLRFDDRAVGMMRVEPDGDVVGVEQLWLMRDWEYGPLAGAAVASDGSLVLVDAGGERESIARVDGDGTRRWTLPLDHDGTGPLTTGGTFLLDSDGVLYLRATRGLNHYIVAVQTDVVPPSDGTCHTLGCGPSRDGWVKE